MPRRSRNEGDLTADLFDPNVVQALRGKRWPANNRFPLNLVHDDSVGDIVRADLSCSESPLIITGYAGLAQIIDFVGGMELDPQPGRPSVTRLLFGAEPYPSREAGLGESAHRLPAEMRSYWLRHNVSLTLAARLLATITALQEGRARARFVDEYPARLHAKLFVGDGAATLGSSNFTRPGLERNIEANVRFERSGAEQKRYEQTRQVAENLWACGKEFTADLIRLLEQLLRWVTWQEALARACAEMLEGEWVREYMAFQSLGDTLPLWPSQMSGIASALILLRNVGSVLIADPTGSGKTRTGAFLLRAVMNQIWSSGRIRKGMVTMVSPPAVVEEWRREALDCHLGLTVHSHGQLSQSRSRQHDQVMQAVGQTQVLAVDEAHNFLNLQAERTKRVLRNVADHLVLFTATPINKSARDLLRVVDMLGADNFEESTVKAIEELYRQQHVSSSHSRSQLNQLKQEIGKFTVRRTKRQLNAMIKRTPEEYCNRAGEPCRYPKHVSKVYPLQESKADRELAAEIRALCEQLIGLTYFQKKIVLPDFLKLEGWTDEKYLNARLHAARKLAAYNVMNALRSSRAAVIEHLNGTEAAVRLVRLKKAPAKQDSGDQMGKLQRLAGKPPPNELECELPDWLIDESAHRQACQAELKIYKRIAGRVAKLSDGRETLKAAQLLALHKKHPLLIAFDAKPITLAVIAEKVTADAGNTPVLIATGSSESEREKIQQMFRPGAEGKRAIALCSDALSEGVNLQRASAVLHLDMPSVVRIAEQRVGRVDRLDSPHKAIEAWWPDDAPEFALRRDDRFLERFETVEQLIGANMPLPAEMRKKWEAKPKDLVKPQDMLDAIEDAEAADWQASDDAFEPVRGMIEGEQAMVDEATYRVMRREASAVLSRVSLVPASRPWAFFCIRGSSEGAPQWIMLDSPGGEPVVDLRQVSECLRKRLMPDTENLQPDEAAMVTLTRFLERLHSQRLMLLPPRKQRLIAEMTFVLNKYIRQFRKDGRLAEAEALTRIVVSIESAEEDAPDLSSVAEAWMDLIRPAWFELLQKRRRSRPMRLKDLRKPLTEDRAIPVADVLQGLAGVQRAAPLSEQIAACIIGYGNAPSAGP